MCASRRSGTWRRAGAAALVLVCSTVCAGAVTKRVLVLQSVGRGFEPHSTISALFQQAIAEGSSDPIEFYEVSLQATSYAGSAIEGPLLDYLKSFETRPGIDLVVAVGGPATKLLEQHRGEVFSRTPMLVLGTDHRHLKNMNFSANDAVFPIRIDLVAAFQGLLTLMPATTNIVVVIGASPLERYWAEQFEQEVRAIAGRVNVTYTNDLPFPEILKRASAPPPRTAILYAIMVVDAAGTPHRGDSALAALRGAARAPIFGLFDFQLGKGIVGGPLIPVRDVAREAAAAALRILQGQAPSRFRLAPTGPGAAAYDARELVRWRIDPSRLPAGSMIQFREPTFWELYRWRLIAVTALCVGQAILIGGLLVSRRRRRAADEAVRRLTRRLVAAQEEERTRLARELHDDVTQRLARLAIDVGRVEHDFAGASEGGVIREVRDGLARLSDDVHALSYRLHPSVLEDLGLAEALQVECEKFSERTAIPVEAKVQDLPAVIPNDASLCLLRVAQEALRNVERHARAQSVNVSLQGLDGGLRLTVQDDGVGVDVSHAQSRPSLGIASMRERVHIFAGRFEFESRPGRGATVQAFIPLREERT